MIERIEGTVATVGDSRLTLMVNGVGYSLSVPDTVGINQGASASLFTYMHWNQEKGPSLYGFADELDRTVFLMIIDCPKIGPSIALKILSNATASQFLETVASESEKNLSSINGIGPKKAEQLIAHLRHKVTKLLSSGSIHVETRQGAIAWNEVSEVLATLNYSRSEISKTLGHLTDLYAGQEAPLDQLIRAGLAFLSKQ